MCGRFVLATKKKELKDLYPLFEIPEVQPRYNIAPTQPVAAARILKDSGKKEVTHFYWGLIPSWAKDPKIGNRLINARADSAPTKPAFRAAFKRRRCLIPTTGFFEWKKVGRIKQPYLFFLENEPVYSMAGLWEYWEQEGNAMESCTILTTDCNDLLRDYHNRMPVIIDRKDYERWLDPTNDTGEGLEDLLKPFDPKAMACYPVDTRVNNVRNDDKTCIEPLPETDLF